MSIFNLSDVSRRVEQSDRPEGEIARVDVLERANAENVAYARTFWTEASPDDFIVAGMSWTDKATGEAYKVALHRPLLAGDPRETDVAVFCQADGYLVFLRRPGSEKVSSRVLATATSREVTQVAR